MDSNDYVRHVSYPDVTRILGQPTILTNDDAMRVAEALKAKVFQVGDGMIYKPFEAKR